MKKLSIQSGLVSPGWIGHRMSEYRKVTYEHVSTSNDRGGGSGQSTVKKGELTGRDENNW